MSGGEHTSQEGAAAAGELPNAAADAGQSAADSAQAEAQQLAAQGVARFNAGLSGEAQRLFVRALEGDPNNFTALYMLGNMYSTITREAEGIELLERAVRTCPERVDARYSLGVAQGKMGNLAGAISSLESVLELKPDMGPALQSLAAFALQSSRTEDAVSAWKRLVEMGAADGTLYRNLAAALQQLDYLDEAIDAYRKAVALLPNDSDLARHVADLLTKTGRRDEAMEVLRKATEVAPGDTQLFQDLARAYHAAGREIEAVEALERGVAANPESLPALEMLVQVAIATGRTEFIESELRRRVAIGFDNADRAGWKLVHLLEYTGRYADAIAAVEEILERDPRNVEFHFLLWNLLLSVGEYQRGFQDYEWFMGLGRYHLRFLNLPRWNGKPLPGRTLLLTAEHDMASTIQFARYIPLAKQRSQARIVVECHDDMMPLLKLVEGVNAVVPKPRPGLPEPQADTHIGLMSLQRFFPTTATSVPGPMPFLTAPAVAMRKAREPVKNLAGLKVGVCWSADADMESPGIRSCYFTDLKPVLTTPGVSCCALQRTSEAEMADAGPGFIDMTVGISDAVDVLGAIAIMDLVIAVDCAVAHIAGALGKPVWVLVPIMPPWVWSVDRQDSSWYPSARLFRQRRAGDWKEPIARLAEALRALSASHRKSS
jgi:tetratricopeptide (TPR) repeat protein